MTPDPIKLLAAVCHRDMNNNATKLEGWKHEDVNRQGPNGNTRQRGAIQKQQDAALSAAAEWLPDGARLQPSLAFCISQKC